MKIERSRLRALKDLVQGLVALALLGGLVAGVPAALASLGGWPLPRSVPRLDAMSHALSQTDIPDAVLIKGAACVCWVAWAVLMVCVAMELAAWLGCYTARRLPFVGPFQVWAARLVASALLVFSSFGGLVRPAAAAPLRASSPPVVQIAPKGTTVRPLGVARPTTQRPARPLRVARSGSQRRGRALRVALGESIPEESLVAAGTPETPIPPGAKTYTVQPDQGRRYDTLWSIAERHLGDPLRWPEISQLNQGRISSQHRFGNPHWIFSDEVLLMPADAVNVDGTPLPSAPARPAPATPPPAPAPARTPPPARAPAPPAAPTAAPPTTAPSRRRAPAPPAAGQAVRPSVGAAVGVPAPPKLPDVPDVTGSSETDATAPPDAPAPAAGGPAAPTVTTPAASGGPVPTTPPTPAATQDPPTTIETPTTTAQSPPTTAAATNGSSGGARRTPRPLRVAPQAGAPRPDRPLRAPSSSARAKAPVSEAKQDTRSARAVELGVGLLLGAGVIAVLRRLRNTQQRRRRPGRHIRLPDVQLAQTEATLRRAGNLDEAALLDRTLRAMAGGLADANREAPAIAGAHLTTRTVEVILAEPSIEAPDNFRASGDGRRWVCERADLGAELPPGTPQPLPTLVTLGRSDKGLVFANLESAGVVSITGGEGARQFVRRAGVELATSTARGNDSVDVVLVGFGEGLDAIEGVRVAYSLDEVIGDVEARSHEAVKSVMRLGSGSTLGSRIAGYDSEFTPLVVVCAADPSDAAMADRLVTAAAPECSGVVALVAGAMKGAGWRLRLADGELEVPPLGLTVQTEDLSEAETENTAQLVALAADQADVADLPEGWPWDPGGGQEGAASSVGHAFDAAASGSQMSTDHDRTDVSINGPAPTDEVEGRATDPGPYVDEPYTVSVDVMGTVRICGGERPIERAKSIELLTLMAMRRQGVTAEQAETALWPDRAPAPNTLNTVTTGARTPLGKAPDGKPLILHVRRGPDTGALRKLHPLVSTDYERFIARWHHAERRPVLGAIETLRDALNLVRGGAFEATPAGGYEWALTGLSEAIRRDVVDAAVRLGELCLEVGDVRGARWAAEQGRRADPYHESLARLAMKSASLDGDPSGVRGVMRALQLDVEDGVEPYDTVEEQTAELYAELTTNGLAAPFRRDTDMAQEMGPH